MSNSTSGGRRAETRQEGISRNRMDRTPTSTSVTVELDVLDCPICCEPLRPPIFQCAVGHLICSSCCGKLHKPKKCYHCSSESDYNRCHGIEKIVGSIQVPCSNTMYGCSMKTSYHEREDHETTCPHAPCFCPDASCSFSGSIGMLQEHFIADHKWLSTKFKYGWCFYTKIKEGVHVISGEDEQLFLLNVVSESFGCSISVFCMWPHDTDPKFRCAVSFTFWKNNLYHTQSSEFEVPSTTLSDGLPRDCFLFIVPKFYLDEDSKICITMKKASSFHQKKKRRLHHEKPDATPLMLAVTCNPFSLGQVAAIVVGFINHHI